METSVKLGFKKQVLRLKYSWSENFYVSAALAEASIIIREHNAATNLFMCAWFNEVVRFTARDQLSFPYVLIRLPVLHLHMFPVCTRKALVNSLGHQRKAQLYFSRGDGQ